MADEKSIVSARPYFFAIASRSGTRSMAMTRPAPNIHALWMANWPTGPHPHTATVSPFSIPQFSAAMYPVGRMSDRNTTLSSGMPSGIFSTLASAHTTRRNWACPPAYPPVRWLYPYSPAGAWPITCRATSAFGLVVSQHE